MSNQSSYNIELNPNLNFAKFKLGGVLYVKNIL